MKTEQQRKQGILYPVIDATTGKEHPNIEINTTEEFTQMNGETVTDHGCVVILVRSYFRDFDKNVTILCLGIHTRRIKKALTGNDLINHAKQFAEKLSMT